MVLYYDDNQEEMVETGMKTVSKLLGITESPIDIKAKVFNFSF